MKIHQVWRFFVLYSIFCFSMTRVPFLRADSIKLKDGTKMEGTVQSENDTEVVFLEEQYGGSISVTRTVDKSQILSVQRATPAEVADRAVRSAFRALSKNQLDPNQSYPLAQYDRVIKDTFQPFIKSFGNSPYAADVNRMIEVWQSERDKVAGGQVRVNNQWVSPSEAAGLQEDQKAQRLLTQIDTNIRSALAASVDLERPETIGQVFTPAKKACTFLLELSRSKIKLTPEQKRLAVEYRTTIQGTIQRRIDGCPSIIESLNKRLEAAKQSWEEARKRLEDLLIRTPGDRGLGFRGIVNQYEGQIHRASTEIQKTETMLDAIHDFQSKATALVTELQGVAISVDTENPPRIPGVQLPPPPDTSLQAAAPDKIPVEENPELLTKIGRWFKKNLILVGAAAVLVLWLMNRFTRN